MHPRTRYHEPTRTPGAGCTSRRGLTVLVLVAVLVCVTSVMMLGQYFFMGQVTDQTGRWSHGHAAETIARSALEESVALLSRSVNDPRQAGDLYKILRTVMPTSSGRHSLRVGPGLLADTERLLRVYGGKENYPLLPVDIEFSKDSPLTSRRKEEFAGTIFLRTGIASKLQENVEREVSLTLGYKVVQLSPLPAAARRALVFQMPEYLVKGRRDVNHIIRTLHDQDVPALRSMIAGLVAEMHGWLEIQPAGPVPTPEEIAVKDFLRTILSDYEGLLASGIFPEEKAMGDRFRAFPADPQDFLLASTVDEVDLARLDLQARLEPEMKYFEEISDQLEEAHRKVSTDIQNRARDANARDHSLLLSRAMEAFVRRVTAIEAVAVDFQQQVEVIPSRSVAYDDLATARYLLDPEHLLQKYSEFSRRVNYIVVEDQPDLPGAAVLRHVPIHRKLLDLFERLDPLDRGLCGTILVDNKSQPLVLDGVRLPGRWTLAVRGGLKVKNLVASDQDFFTVMALGVNSAEVHLAGRVDASVVVTGRRLHLEPGTRIKGSLLLRDLAASTETQFTGKVERDLRLHDSGSLEFRHVLISPWNRTQRSKRQLRD